MTRPDIYVIAIEKFIFKLTHSHIIYFLKGEAGLKSQV